MGDLGTPTQLVRGYGSPHAYQMRPSDAASLRDAGLILWIGPELEAFLRRSLEAPAGDARVLALGELPGLRLLPGRGGGVHAHTGSDHHDPHVWLNPDNARIMAGAIAAALASLDPDNAQTYRGNLARLEQRIDALRDGLVTKLEPVRTVPFVVFHDAFQYFEDSFGLASVGSVTVSPDRMPSAKRIGELRREIVESGARCVFREPQFESALVSVLLEGTDAKAGVLDPLGTGIPPGPDAYVEMMSANADALVQCLGGDRAQAGVDGGAG